MRAVLCVGLLLAFALGCGKRDREPVDQDKPRKEPVYQDKPLGHWIEQIKGKDAKARQQAIFVLEENIGAEGKAAVPALQAALEDDDRFTRTAAARALTRVDPTLEKPLRVLIDEGLKDKERFFRELHVAPLVR